MPAFVYMIEDPISRAIKIGVTTQDAGAEARAKQLQTGNPNTLRVALTIEVATERCAYAAEKRVHAVFAANRTREGGEWFSITAAEAAFVVEAIAEEFAPGDAPEDVPAEEDPLEARRAAYWAAEEARMRLSLERSAKYRELARQRLLREQENAITPPST